MVRKGGWGFFSLFLFLSKEKPSLLKLLSDVDTVILGFGPLRNGFYTGKFEYIWTTKYEIWLLVFSVVPILLQTLRVVHVQMLIFNHLPFFVSFSIYMAFFSGKQKMMIFSGMHVLLFSIALLLWKIAAWI